MNVLLEKPAPETVAAPREFHWTVDAFYFADAAGVFGSDARLELVHGRIIERMGQGPLHLSRRVRVGRRLRAILEPCCLVVDECPVRIASDSEPVADIAVLDGAEGDYDERNPAPEEVALLVEIAVTSVEYDLGAKALLYAQAGIGDYWVVLPEIEAIVVHREPGAGGYQSIIRVGTEETLSPLAAPDAVFLVRDLFGPAIGEASIGVN
jgi:Uma2 family endonuclease